MGKFHFLQTSACGRPRLTAVPGHQRSVASLLNFVTNSHREWGIFPKHRAFDPLPGRRYSRRRGKGVLNFLFSRTIYETADLRPTLHSYHRVYVDRTCAADDKRRPTGCRPRPGRQDSDRGIPSNTVLQGFKRGTEGDRYRNGPHACGAYRNSRRDHGRISKPSHGRRMCQKRWM